MMFELDWANEEPAHPVCSDLMEVPTIRVQPPGFGYPDYPKPDEDDDPHIAPAEELVVQWYGDDERGYITRRNLQFSFLLQADPRSIHWMLHPERFRTIMLGPLKNWPNQEALEGMLGKGRNPEETVLYVINGDIGLDDGKGGVRPAALMVNIVLLADDLFGIIRPRPYLNLAVRDEEIARIGRV